MKIKKPVIIFLLTKIYTWINFIVFGIIRYNLYNKKGSFFDHLKMTLYSWDVSFYISIGLQNAYIKEPWKTAFFPLYPMSIKIFHLFIKDDIWAAIIASNVFLLLGSIYMYNLIKDIHEDKIATFSLLFFLISPMAVFFITGYSESLFFFLTVAGFYYMNKKKWGLTSIFFMFSTAARVVGVFSLIPFAYEYLNDFQEKNKNVYLKLLTYMVVISSGIISYMVYLWIHFNDPIYFFHSIQAWPERHGFVFPFFDFLRHVKHLPESFRLTVDSTVNNLSFLYTFFCGLLLIYGIKKIRFSYWLYFFSIYAFLSFQPEMTSFARYFTNIFPVWILLSIWIEERKKFKDAIFYSLIFVMLIWQFYMNFRWYVKIWVN